MSLPPTPGLSPPPALERDRVAPNAVLTDPWVRWITENALRGASTAELEAGLVAGGAAGPRATSEVGDVLRSPILAGAQAIMARSAGLEQAVRLHRALDSPSVPDRTALDPDTLYREHWTTHRPVVLRGGAAGWPAARWTFADLRTRFRWAPVDVLVRGPGWWWTAREIRRMPFGELVDAALGPPSDRLYADGHTALLDQAGLAPLRAELGVLPGVAGDGHPRAWVGPQGTVTPTHHDQSNAWQVQLVGRKRVHLASPLESTLVATTVGLYNTVDPRETPAGEGAEVRWHCLELGPGDAVFVPVGWWHHVEALEPSISVSLSGFLWPNAYPWYLPGRRQD